MRHSIYSSAMRTRLIIIAAMLIVAAVAAWLLLFQPDEARLTPEAVSGRVPELSNPRFESIPTVDIADAVGWPDGAKPAAARGLTVTAFADGLDHPRWLYRLPNGDILVAETNSPPRTGGGITGMVMGHLMKRAGAGVPSANRITLLRDTDGDGVADARSALLENLNSPFGMVLLGDWLYVANTDALVRYPYKPGQTKITAAPQKVIDLPGGGNHWARNVVAAPDGKHLYVSIGSATNIADNGLDAEQGRAQITEIEVASGKTRVYAYGLRNPVGMAFDPIAQRLWAVVNERDMMGSDMPPDYMTAVSLGEFFGWPWNYWGGYIDKRVQPERPDLVEYTKRPDFALGAHTAPLGIDFAGDIRLGPDYANGAFVSLHGSWNRDPPAGYKVVFVPFADNGFPVRDAKPVDVVTGFLNADGKAQGRPVGVIADATGAMLIADDVGNVIWRIAPPRPIAAPPPVQ